MSFPHSPKRRRLILAALLCASLPIAGCSSQPAIGGTFLQLWRSHLDWSHEQWRSRLAATREFGCQEIFVQWVGIDGEPGNTWSAPDTLIQLLLDQCQRLGIGVHLGLPYDERWWQAIGSQDGQTLDAFLQRTHARGSAYMRDAAWPRHPAFRGWYVPYELEQYNWAAPARLDRLAGWLAGLSDVAVATSGQPPAISTYFSQLPTPGTLAGMWSTLLDRVKLYPMIQDGVGVAGMRNYASLEPLHDLFIARRVKFDLILELFEQLPAEKADGSDFRARSASFGRIEAQWKIARDYGSQRLVAFALDPWVLGDSPEAAMLRREWASHIG